MYKLNLPDYKFSFQKKEKEIYIFDKIRKKYVFLTPEEWVRQNFIEYLIREKKYKPGLISVEMFLKINNLNRRCDIVIFSESAEPLCIVELKAATVPINQRVFDQIARYNIEMKVKYLIVSNGLNHYCYKMDFDNSTYKSLGYIPDYNQLNDDNI